VDGRQEVKVDGQQELDYCDVLSFVRAAHGGLQVARSVPLKPSLRNLLDNLRSLDKRR